VKLRPGLAGAGPLPYLADTLKEVDCVLLHVDPPTAAGGDVAAELPRGDDLPGLVCVVAQMRVLLVGQLAELG
jgi:hypothetical protein